MALGAAEIIGDASAINGNAMANSVAATMATINLRMIIPLLLNELVVKPRAPFKAKIASRRNRVERFRSATASILPDLDGDPAR